MTVAELIAILQAMPQGLPVVIKEDCGPEGPDPEVCTFRRWFDWMEDREDGLDFDGAKMDDPCVVLNGLGVVTWPNGPPIPKAEP